MFFKQGQWEINLLHQNSWELIPIWEQVTRDAQVEKLKEASHPVEFFPPLITVGHASQAGWDVPEANIGVLRLQKEKKR